MKRVVAYIDGFNLYFGLKSKSWRKYYWLNVQALAQNILKPDQKLQITKYFTSRIKSPDDKKERQSDYLEALETLNHCNLFFGKYLMSKTKCRNCGYIYSKPSEKETDVNIAVELLSDAVTDKYDEAMLISGDSDLAPAIKRAKELMPDKRIIVAFPPNRVSKELKKVADAYFFISESKFKKSLFPDEIIKKDQYKLIKPQLWR